MWTHQHEICSKLYPCCVYCYWLYFFFERHLKLNSQDIYHHWYQIQRIQSKHAAKCTCSVLVTEEEVLTLAEELRPYVEEAMKIEPAPWIKDYLVDMDDLYTELTLEKLENKPSGPFRRKLENYKELFSVQNVRHPETNAPSSKFQRQKRRKKILFKGEPGRGKRPCQRKIAWDWAKGLFTSISIIFFVFLKLVKPGDAIENVIISQTPALQGMGIKKEQIGVSWKPLVISV